MRAERILADAFLAAHPLEAAPLLEQASSASSADVLRRSPAPVIAATLQRMAPPEAAALLARLPAERASGVLADMPLGAAATMLRLLDAVNRNRLLTGASEETARSLRTALLHPERSAGSMMDVNVIAFPVEISAGEARRRARKAAAAGNYAYVVDEQRRLVGAIALSELIRASPKEGLASLMRTSVVRLQARAEERAILDHAGWRELHAIPVVDSEGVLVGVLRRETYERLRSERSADNSAGTGVALAEFFWAVMISTVDEFARAARPEDAAPRLGGGDGH